MQQSSRVVRESEPSLQADSDVCGPKISRQPNNPIVQSNARIYLVNGVAQNGILVLDLSSGQQSSERSDTWTNTQVVMDSHYIPNSRPEARISVLLYLVRNCFHAIPAVLATVTRGLFSCTRARRARSARRHQSDPIERVDTGATGRNCMAQAEAE